MVQRCLKLTKEAELRSLVTLGLVRIYVICGRGREVYSVSSGVGYSC